jgi:hypothetical protein
MDMGVSIKEAKTLSKSRYKGKWEKEHQGYNKEDWYYQFNREEQVTIFRLCTGQNRLRQHMFSKLKIDTTDMSICGLDKISASTTNVSYSKCSARTDMAITSTNTGPTVWRGFQTLAGRCFFSQVYTNTN